MMLLLLCCRCCYFVCRLSRASFLLIGRTDKKGFDSSKGNSFGKVTVGKEDFEEDPKLKLPPKMPPP